MKLRAVYTILLILALAAAVSAADSTVTGWQKSLQIDFTTTQTSYSNSWVGGEAGSANWVSNLNGSAEKALSSWLDYNSKLRLSFGQTLTQDAETKDWSKPVKSTDLIDWENVFRFTMHKFVDPYAAVRLESQFVDASNPDKKIYLSPMKWTESVGAFKQLIASGGFGTVFQPIIDARTGAIHHYEALTRFPDSFGASTTFEQITFAERSGLIIDFDLAMAQKVITWLRTTPLNSSISVAVNISGHSVDSPAYLARLSSILEDNPWTRGQLMFEITESARMQNLSGADSFIQHLRRQGYPVCLDDFGAGAANFEYLASLDVDIVKLDGDAVRGAQKAHKGKAFLRAFLGLCRELGVVTVAEMIDDEAGLDFVRECGIHYVQGYLFGRPSEDIRVFKKTVPAELFRRKTTRRTA